MTGVSLPRQGYIEPSLALTLYVVKNDFELLSDYPDSTSPVLEL